MCKKLIFLISFVLVFGLVGSASARMVGHWKFDRAADSNDPNYLFLALDWSGNDFHGRAPIEPDNPDCWACGIIPFSNDAAIITDPFGLRGKVLDLDGAADFLKCGNEPKMFMEDAVTLAAWVYFDMDKLNALPPCAWDFRHICGKGDVYLRMYLHPCRPGSSESYRTKFKGVEGEVILGDTKINDGQWHHVATTFDGQMSLIYLDGEVDGELNLIGKLWPYASDSPFQEFYIGGLAGVCPCHGFIVPTGEDRCWPGMIDDLRLYDHALTQQEIQDLLYDPDPALAYDPFPPDDAIDWPKERVPIMWSPGAYIQDVNGHRLYISTNKTEVENRTVAPIGTTEPNYNATLVPGKTYYWCVDEVDDANGNTWPGYVWKFMVRPYILPPVEDFESYISDANLQTAWEPVSENTTSVYLSKVLEDGYAYESEQSMGFDYNNMVEPYYSEAGREFDTAQDWTTEDVTALALWFRGKYDNKIEQMYVALEDAFGNDTMVPYDGEVNDIQNEEWQQWNIALQDFTDVNMAHIKKVFIGFGDRYEPIANDANGLVYFDDIKLYVTRCVPEFAGADVDDDCIVDFKDFEIMTDDWLDVDWDNTDFNGILTDFNEAITDTNSQWVTGRIGNALEFDGTRSRYYPSSYVEIPDGLAEISEAITVALWQYGKIPGVNVPGDPYQPFNCCLFSGANSQEAIRMGAYPTVGHWPWYVLWIAGVNDEATDRIEWFPIDQEEFSIFNGQWNHWAFTKDCGTGWMRIYLNGSQAKARPGKVVPMDNITIFRIGEHILNGWNYTGLIDDFRIYKRELDPNEIKDLADLLPGPIDDPNLIRWYKFNETSGLIAEQSVDADPVYHPVESPANLYDSEAKYSKKVNFKDYAVLVDAWLEEQLWPPSP